MKQFIVNSIFNLGDLVSRSFIFGYAWGYKLYSKLMQKSVNLQDKWGLKSPWSEPVKTNEAIKITQDDWLSVCNDFKTVGDDMKQAMNMLKNPINKRKINLTDQLDGI